MKGLVCNAHMLYPAGPGIITWGLLEKFLSSYQLSLVNLHRKEQSCILQQKHQLCSHGLLVVACTQSTDLRPTDGPLAFQKQIC